MENGTLHQPIAEWHKVSDKNCRMEIKCLWPLPTWRFNQLRTDRLYWGGYSLSVHLVNMSISSAAEGGLAHLHLSVVCMLFLILQAKRAYISALQNSGWQLGMQSESVVALSIVFRGTSTLQQTKCDNLTMQSEVESALVCWKTFIYIISSEGSWVGEVLIFFTPLDVSILHHSTVYHQHKFNRKQEITDCNACYT